MTNSPGKDRLVARVGGVRCLFDGDRWETADAALAQLLNIATPRRMTTPMGIRQLGEYILRSLELPDFRIVSAGCS